MQGSDGLPALHLLYGGTFDPVHHGHLAVARAALEASGAEGLDFLPAADPPHRAAPGAGFADRVAMIDAALASEPRPSRGRWSVDPSEGQRPGPSFTVDTLQAWRARHPAGACLGFVLGADAFRGLPSWHAWRSLFGLAHLLVAGRPGSALDDLPVPLADAVSGRWTSDPLDLRRAPAGRLFALELPLRPESATAVRRALAHARPMEGLPKAVAALIEARGLYGGLAHG